MKKNSAANKYLVLYGHCFPVYGKDNGAIYNLQGGDIIPVPNAMISLVGHMKTQTINDCKSLVDSEEFLTEYVDFLIKNDLAFFTDAPQNFPSVSTEYHSPEFIKHAVIEYKEGAFDIRTLFRDLDALLCKHVELRMIDSEVDFLQLKNIFASADKTTIRSIDVHCHYTPALTEVDLKSLATQFKKINFINVFGSPEEKVDPEHYIRYTTANYQLISTRHFPKDVYIVNLNYFAEAKNWNPYYNKKVCIDRKGNIKNCLLHEKSFGNVNDNCLQNIHLNEKFTRLWAIKPDMIENVKESELRYCTLYSENIKHENGKFYLVDE